MSRFGDPTDVDVVVVPGHDSHRGAYFDDFGGKVKGVRVESFEVIELMPVVGVPHNLVLFQEFHESGEDGDSVLEVDSKGVPPLQLRDVPEGVHRKYSHMV